MFCCCSLHFSVLLLVSTQTSEPRHCCNHSAGVALNARFITVVFSRDEHWTGLGLDWIRPMTNFAGFGLEPDWKLPHNLGIGPELDCVNGK